MNQRTPYHLSGPSGEWAVTIGLEVHAQIASHAKLFSGAATHFGAEPNTQVAFLDAGMPGQLPVINSVCIDQAIRVGLGLNAEIHLYSRFDRKNYFYPDLPQGYQISQFALPIVGQGAIEIDGSDGTRFKIRIERLHLEQDAGKSIHDLDPSASYVDLNRSGVALMEIVSFPDMQSPDEAADYVRSLRAILMALKACHGDMEKGHLRADVNVSVRRLGDDTLGTRCEIKNVNSFRFIRESIEFEARRQVDLLEDGGTIEQETRLFDPTSGRTRTMRSKEDAHDYRYFPDPDLPPLRLKPERVERIRAALPELPAQKRARFMHEYGLSEYDARVLTDDLDRAEFFEHVAKGRDSRLAANWVSQELSAVLNRDDTPITDSPIKAQQLGRLIDLISAGTISGAIAKRVFALMLEETGADPEQLVEREGLKQMTDTSAIEALVDKIIAQNPEQAAQIEQQKADGHAKPKALGWFVGQVMKASGGKANPPAVNSVLKNRFGL